MQKATFAALAVIGMAWLPAHLGGQQPQQAPAGITVDPTTPKKHVLVLAFTNGFYHGSTTDGAATIWQLGRESGLFDVDIRTDTKWITKGNAGPGESRNISTVRRHLRRQHDRRLAARRPAEERLHFVHS